MQQLLDQLEAYQSLAERDAEAASSQLQEAIPAIRRLLELQEDLVSELVVSFVGRALKAPEAITDDVGG